MTKAHCDTRNAKFYNLNEATLIERNFELGTRHVKVCFRDESLKRERIMLRTYASIQPTQRECSTRNDQRHMLLQLCEGARGALLPLLPQGATGAQGLAPFAPRESKRSKEDFLSIQKLGHDSLMDRVQLIIDYYLLLLWFIEPLSRFIEHRNYLQLQTLVIK